EGSRQLQLFASGIGMLILLLYCPGGLISIVHSIRDVLLAFIARRTGWKPPVRTSEASIAHLSTRHPDAVAGDGLMAPALVAHDIKVQYGGRFVVTGASIDVRRGEVVGLIGTNGAGKTTLMNAISGFVRSSGEIEVFGRRIDRMAPSRRAQQGMG